ERVVAGGVELGRTQRSVDPLVIGDGDDVEVGATLHVLEDLRHRCGAVGIERVDVHVGAAALATAARRIAAPPSRAVPLSQAHAAASGSRSGQYGWKAPHPCSGAAAMSRSSRRASASTVAATSARRFPVAATSIGSP